MKTVLIAGSTGYLGRFLLKEYRRRGWRVLALVRNRQRAQSLKLDADALIEAAATDSKALEGTMVDVDLVVSALGITRQRDRMTYQQVDFQANANLLDEAISAGVDRFVYVHVLNGEAMRSLPAIQAKQQFVDRLRNAPLRGCVVSPSGFFSDMEDFYRLAQRGRIWLFGRGDHRLNPIHGEDLAEALATAEEAGQDRLDVGGPEVFTHREMAELAFETLGKKPRITCLPDSLRTASIRLLPYVTPIHIYGPAQMFLTAMGMDMVGEPHGSHRLQEHFLQLHASDGALEERC